MSFSAIILAAGASRRMGRDKALLEYKGETFLGRLRRVLGACCREVIVVGAPEAPFSADAINPRPEDGMLSSLQCGLRAILSSSDAVLFTLVDLPAIDETTLRTLVSGWSGEPLRIPRHEGKRGHPVMLSRALIPEFLACSGTPRDVIVRHESSIVYVDVEDPGVVTDADTIEEYQRLVANG